MEEGNKKVNLPDESLDTVVGGFQEQNKSLETYGMEIKCPVCGNSKARKFSPNVLKDPKTGSVEYRCGCGTAFVCYGGSVILKADWIAQCNSKGYVYPFP